MNEILPRQTQRSNPIFPHLRHGNPHFDLHRSLGNLEAKHIISASVSHPNMARRYHVISPFPYNISQRLADPRSSFPRVDNLARKKRQPASFPSRTKNREDELRELFLGALVATAKRAILLGRVPAFLHLDSGSRSLLRRELFALPLLQRHRVEAARGRQTEKGHSTRTQGNRSFLSGFFSAGLAEREKERVACFFGGSASVTNVHKLCVCGDL